MATKVNTAAEILPVLSVLKFRRPIARPPRTTVNWSHERNVRSFAKNTNWLESCWIIGTSTLWFDSDGEGDSGAYERVNSLVKGIDTWMGLKERLRRHSKQKLRK